jgi:hypothetical protein
MRKMLLAEIAYQRYDNIYCLCPSLPRQGSDKHLAFDGETYIVTSLGAVFLAP